MKKLLLLSLTPFLLLFFYNISLAINHFLQIKQLKKTNTENIKYFAQENPKEYIYRTKIYYSPEQVLYQAPVALIFIYVKKTLNVADLNSLSASVMHKYADEKKTINLKFSDFRLVDNIRLQRDGYLCYRVVQSIKMFFIGNNYISFAIKGIKLNMPQEDIQIMLVFPFDKGSTIPILFLVKAIKSGGIAIILIIIFYAVKLIKTRRLKKQETSEENRA